MNVNIVIPDQIEAALRRKAATVGQDLKEYLQRVVTEDVETEEELATPPKGESTEAFMARLRAMVRPCR